MSSPFYHWETWGTEMCLFPKITSNNKLLRRVGFKHRVHLTCAQSCLWTLQYIEYSSYVQRQWRTGCLHVKSPYSSQSDVGGKMQSSGLMDDSLSWKEICPGLIPSISFIRDASWALRNVEWMLVNHQWRSRMRIGLFCFLEQ